VISGCPRRRTVGRRKRILCGHPLTGVGRFPSGRRPSRPCHTRNPPLLPTCISMHRCSPAELPDVCREGASHRRLSPTMTRCGRHASAVDEPARPIGVHGRTFKVLAVESHEITVKNHAVTGRDVGRVRPRCTVAT